MVAGRGDIERIGNVPGRDAVSMVPEERSCDPSRSGSARPACLIAASHETSYRRWFACRRSPRRSGCWSPSQRRVRGTPAAREG